MKYFLFFLSATLVFLFSGCSFRPTGNSELDKFMERGKAGGDQPTLKDSTKDSTSTTSQESEIADFAAFTASFEIYTNGTRRIFTQSMYHGQSDEVYLEASDPNLVQVKARDITWNDFFKTLPFSLTKECLVTGTGQKFCSSESGQLKFFLNDLETPDVLDLKIQPNDRLRVEYK